MNAFKIILSVIYIITCITIIWFSNMESPTKYIVLIILLILYVTISKIYENKKRNN